MGLDFPYVEDAAGEAYGEGVWSNAVAMVVALVGHGFTLVRRNKTKVRLGLLNFFRQPLDKCLPL